MSRPTAQLPMKPVSAPSYMKAVATAPASPPPALPPRDPAIVSVLVSEKNPATSPWKSLFNGQDLTNWESSKFGGDGEIKVANGAVVLDVGGDLTGITYTGE